MRPEKFVGTAALLCALCVAGIVARAQVGAAVGSVTQPKSMAPDADPDWEVVAVKPSDPMGENQTIRVSGRHLVIQRQTVETMLMVGYGLQKNQIVDAPKWVRTENFDADGLANMDGQPSVQQFQSMVRKLLVQRFRLKMHLEQREMPVFALTIAKDGPKLKNASKPDALAQQEVRGGEGYRMLQFTTTSMQDLTTMMLQYLDRPLIDQTGLKGKYDFNLNYTYDEARAPTDGSAPPSLFTAIQEQMGLKLEPVKAPAKVLAIESIEQPSEN